MSVTINKTNMAAAFQERVKENPGCAALVIDEQSWTRQEISDLADRAAGLLSRAGVVRGDTVVVQYDTLAVEVALALAIARIGGTLMPVPKRLGAKEVNYLLERASAKVFAHQGEQLPEGVKLPAGASAICSAEVSEATPVKMDVAETSADHVVLIGVTSGSTGQPKGVMHTWDSIAWSAERMRALVDVQSGEAISVTGAGAGAPGFTIFSYLGLVFGVTLVKPARWNPARVLELADKHKTVWSCMVPTMLEMLLEARPEVLGDRKLEHMRGFTLGGGVMPASLMQRARQELGVEVLRMYAMAECMVVASMSLDDPEDERDFFDGRADIARGASLAIFDDDRKPLPVGDVGEIGLKGPSQLVGYLGDPSGKADLMTEDGYFLSGDLGKLTPDGYIKVVGRKKDMVIRGGYNIDASEVEEHIKSHPDVAKVAVVGYPDKVFGERACAVIETRSGNALSLEELVAHLLGQGLSKEKLPERIECWDELPLSPDGKILKGNIKKAIGGDVFDIAVNKTA